jgi:uncharacterized membrane-anchored protein YhcB (DUF1043 family)
VPVVLKLIVLLILYLLKLLIGFLCIRLLIKFIYISSAKQQQALQQLQEIQRQKEELERKERELRALLGGHIMTPPNNNQRLIF